MNKVVVRKHPSESVGRAVYASCNIEVGGLVISSLRLRELSERDKFSMEYDGQHVLIDEPGVVVNHSCSPNCKVVQNNAGAFDFIALKDISEGEEITFDYLSNESKVTAFTDCRCASHNCRQTLNPTTC